MFILIELDFDWSVGIDWGKVIKGVRLGFIGIHLIFMKYTDYHKALFKYPEGDT